MASIKPHQYDPESWDDGDAEPTFQQITKQSDKAQTTKDLRRQQGKEWGRSMHKFQKQRQKNGKP
ncbi:hypothetical protein F8S13_15235 [Chloroflexia bacterium SDU3-3]|nr:hypothetical protein F8S13_15235 [Chloroflexia bacterium SDU3-3]